MQNCALNEICEKTLSVLFFSNLVSRAEKKNVNLKQRFRSVFFLYDEDVFAVQRIKPNRFNQAGSKQLFCVRISSSSSYRRKSTCVAH